MNSLEYEVEKVVVALIKEALDPSDTLPVKRSDESDSTEAFAMIVVMASRQGSMVIDEADYLQSLFEFEVSVELRSFLPEKKESEMEARSAVIHDKLISNNAGNVDLSRFRSIWIKPPSTYEAETDADGRRTRTRNFMVCAEENRS